MLYSFFLGDNPSSECYVPTFRNTVCSILIGGVSRKNNRDDINLPAYATYEYVTDFSETSEHKI